MLDEFDDDAEAVVPVSMMPTPQVISSGGSSSGAADTQCRAKEYNERMARARQASKKTGSAGLCDYARPSWLELLSASYA